MKILKQTSQFKKDLKKIQNNPPKIARRMGINASLMRQYAMGQTYIGSAKKKQIENEIHNIGKELMAVSF